MSNPVRVLIGKPGLDGHDRGAKFIARLLKDEGFEVIYTGIRRTPEEIVHSAIQEDVRIIGLSSLSGAHLKLFPKVVELLKEKNCEDIAVVGGGVIPDDDVEELLKSGLKAIFTPGTPAAKIIETFKRLSQ